MIWCHDLTSDSFLFGTDILICCSIKRIPAVMIAVKTGFWWWNLAKRKENLDEWEENVYLAVRSLKFWTCESNILCQELLNLSQKGKLLLLSALCVAFSLTILGFTVFFKLFFFILFKLIWSSFSRAEMTTWQSPIREATCKYYLQASRVKIKYTGRNYFLFWMKFFC